MKPQRTYECEQCGNRQPKWLGRCPECGAWNSFIAYTTSGSGSSGSPGSSPAHAALSEGEALPISLSEIELKKECRHTIGVPELDRVLGGGVMAGASILIGGEPGIGKSTLLLQTAEKMGRADSPTLYISGEETAAQIHARAARLGVADESVHILCSSSLEHILAVITKQRPATIVVDSIQTLYSSQVGPVSGTPSQVRYCCNALIQLNRQHGSCLFLIAHVTKEGAIAGPKMMEHIVDTVIYFEQSNSDIRFLRATKNRFGAIDEIGLFEMTEKGLQEIADPNSLFLIPRKGTLPAGVALAAIYEGSRVFLIELQALTVAAKGGTSRLFSDRIDASRVARVAAVIEKHVGIVFSDQDIYVNVGGGIRISEVGVELPLAHALYSARTGIAMPHHSIMMGELTLAGEVRPIGHIRQRIKTITEMGYLHAVGPNVQDSHAISNYHAVATLSESIAHIFASQASPPSQPSR